MTFPLISNASSISTRFGSVERKPKTRQGAVDQALNRSSNAYLEKLTEVGYNKPNATPIQIHATETASDILQDRGVEE